MNKRRLLAGIAIIGAVPALATGWSAYLGLTTWHHLTQTRSALAGAHEDLSAALTPARPSAGRVSSLGSLSRALAESLPALAAALADARAHAAAARQHTGGADWDLLTHLPLVGDQAAAVRGISRAADELTAALDELQHVLVAMKGVDASGIRGLSELLTKLTGIDVGRVVDRARIRLARARAELARVPSTGIGSIDSARANAILEIDQLRRWVDKAAVVATIPALFGRTEPSRYFLAFQTNAEARGTGGLVGAFGILSAGGGKLSIEKLAANTGLANTTTPVTDHGHAFLARYGPSALELLSNSNLSPHFPYAAETWTRLWQRQTGRRLDGAIATDPVGLARLLGLAGPVTLPGGEQVTAANVVDLTERAAYARYPDPIERKRFLVTIARTVSDALTNLSGADALPVLFQLVDEGRLRIWSRHEAQQARLAATPLGGTLPPFRGPYAGLVVNNSGGTKLDYYLDRELHYDLGAREGDARTSRVRIKLTNDVPGGDLPKYVTYRMDAKENQPPVGTNRLWVSYYAPVGASLQAARIDGAPAEMIMETERTHPVYSKLIEIGPRKSVTIEFELREPYSEARPNIPVQPLVRPQRSTVTCAGRSCP
ncbi:hypothetical protein Acor_03310 [Acrocarpospora corrugata]|uniref:DUF4012 domain-containing protein n=1 Tax=Acrocarpospora corrugata TaxID=35763 RepID=A0A5M3VQH3_9ACTN|nr:DUF4012 domain-containing protein [Acrocarpospora corrugata]GER98269.1 hypothetical protein Acor_03310 [Acrocarpospora corrugata]